MSIGNTLGETIKIIIRIKQKARKTLAPILLALCGSSVHISTQEQYIEIKL